MKTIALALSILTISGSVPAFCLEMPEADKEYFIAAGDVININVLPAQEFSKEVTVQPDGTIEIPLLGTIKAQGFRAEELQKVLITKFSKYVSNPSITLNVRKFSSSRVAVIGRINSPGYFEYREGMRLLDLVAQAGGVQDYARTSKITIFRSVKGPNDKVLQEVVKADLNAVFNGKLDKNILLASGDIVSIPRKPYSETTKWITDNIIPWATFVTVLISANLLVKNN
jgi:polysaccharide biosynthesis/export protein